MKNIIIAIIAIILIVWGISYLKSNSDSKDGSNTQATTTVEKITGFSKVQPSLRSIENGVTVVSYSTKGFAPFIVEVKVGETVRFTNNRNDKALRVVSTGPENSDLFYSGFSAAASIARGESFELPFTKVGAWSYTNLNDDNHQGVVIVTE